MKNRLSAGRSVKSMSATVLRYRAGCLNGPRIANVKKVMTPPSSGLSTKEKLWTGRVVSAPCKVGLVYPNSIRDAQLIIGTNSLRLSLSCVVGRFMCHASSLA
jgi:hypothetical protein